MLASSELKHVAMDTQFAVPWLVLLCSFIGADKTIDWCESPQYLDIGMSGTIECTFEGNFFGVLWYNSTDFAIKEPIVTLFGTQKGGTGFHSGEFNVHFNGSLVINNVTLFHEHSFHVSKFSSQDEDPISISVEVIVTVKSPTSFPVINFCHERNNCLTSIPPQSTINCTVSNSRPPVALVWLIRTSPGDKLVATENYRKQNGQLYSTYIITSDAFLYSSGISLLVCRTNNTFGVIEKEESSILVQNTNYDLTVAPLITKYLIFNSTMELLCNKTEISFLVWKKSSAFGHYYHDILYAIFVKEFATNVYLHSYVMGNDGSLIVSRVGLEHEGFYSCLHGDGTSEGIANYRVYVYVSPSILHPIVEGCNRRQHCVLEINEKGNLTCSVSGIRPEIQLEWKIDDSSETIKFIDHNLTVIENGDSFDVTLISRYRVSTDNLPGRVTITCKTAGPGSELFNGETSVALLISASKSTGQYRKWLVFAAIAIVLLALVSGGIFIVKKGICHPRRSQINTDELEMNTPMIMKILPTKEFKEKRRQLLNQMKRKYENLYQGVRPIPFLRDKLVSVNKIFVDTDMVCLSLDGRDTENVLYSYQDLLLGPNIKSRRIILEGEPGYGKSTLILQLAYDWCNKVNHSPMCQVDVFVLLRFRQLSGVQSIFKAIQQFILPKDSSLDEEDIRLILYGSSSVMIVLDGFDEYPDKDIDTESDFKEIIMRNMFQTCTVILTTRTNCLPKDFAPQTERIMLSGFNKKARRQYIRKTVVGKNDIDDEQIETQLERNPVLSDLCQVPLFFVMYTHIFYDKKEINFNSVTNFFEYIITCCHSHMENKMGDLNTVQYDLFATKHEELDKLALEGLIGANHRLSWRKDDLYERLGATFCDKYIRVGILVEEDISMSDLVRKSTKIKFYHKLFCEWYAGHELSREIQRVEKAGIDVERVETQSEYVRELLDKFDPFDVQYLLRFTCGLSSDAGCTIIQYMNERAQSDRILILCILEYGGENETVINAVKRLCMDGIVISNGNTALLKRSKIHLLEMASRNKINISRLRLDNCFEGMDTSQENIILSSYITVPVLSTLKELVLEDTSGREISDDDVINILRFISQSTSFEKLMFWGCLLSYSFQPDIFRIIQLDQFSVWWCPKGVTDYHLNFKSGLWEHENTNEILELEEYEEEKANLLNLKKRVTNFSSQQI